MKRWKPSLNRQIRCYMAKLFPSIRDYLKVLNIQLADGQIFTEEETENSSTSGPHIGVVNYSKRGSA